jgi:hypothetical protein
VALAIESLLKKSLVSIFRQKVIPSFLHSASLPLAQPFTDHTEHALCSAKKGQSRELGISGLFVV